MNKLDKAFWLAWGIAMGIFVYQETTGKMREIARQEAREAVDRHAVCHEDHRPTGENDGR